MSTGRKHFIRHYLEMVVAMFAGMLILGAPSELAMSALGTSWSQLGDELVLLWMATIMTVPMVAWMRFRGHGARANAEMAASMYLAALAAIALLLGGVAQDGGALMGAEHVAMLASMLGAMLLRPAEYTGHHTHAVSA